MKINRKHVFEMIIGNEFLTINKLTILRYFLYIRSDVLGYSAKFSVTVGFHINAGECIGRGIHDDFLLRAINTMK